MRNPSEVLSPRCGGRQDLWSRLSLSQKLSGQWLVEKRADDIGWYNQREPHGFPETSWTRAYLWEACVWLWGPGTAIPACPWDNRILENRAKVLTIQKALTQNRPVACPTAGLSSFRSLWASFLDEPGLFGFPMTWNHTHPHWYICFQSVSSASWLCGKSLNSSVPQFPHLERTDNTYFIGLLGFMRYLMRSTS